MDTISPNISTDKDACCEAPTPKMENKYSGQVGPMPESKTDAQRIAELAKAIEYLVGRERNLTKQINNLNRILLHHSHHEQKIVIPIDVELREIY